MQLARLAYPEPRGWTAKFRQVCRALSLERQFNKHWILEQYLNHAPYGGNLQGVRAAKRGLAELALGGTAVGTGLNAPPTFADQVLSAMRAGFGGHVEQKDPTR